MTIRKLRTQRDDQQWMLDLALNMRGRVQNFERDDLEVPAGKRARNYMRDQMQLGDRVLFYHSSCEVPGIAGIAEVSKLAYPDETQFDKKSKYFDPKATRENPRWVHVNVKLVKKTRLVPLSELRTYPQLAKMQLLQRGNRLSITPVDPKEWKFIEGIL